MLWQCWRKGLRHPQVTGCQWLWQQIRECYCSQLQKAVCSGGEVLPALFEDLSYSQGVGMQCMLCFSHWHPCWCCKTSHHWDKKYTPEVKSNRRCDCFPCISPAAPVLVSWKFTWGSYLPWSRLVSNALLITGWAQSHGRSMVLPWPECGAYSECKTILKLT